MGKKLNQMAPAEMLKERARGRERYLHNHPGARGGHRVDDPRTPEDFRAEAEEHRLAMLRWHAEKPARDAARQRGYNERRRQDPELRERNRQYGRTWCATHPELVSLYGRRSVLRKYLKNGKTALKNGLDVFEELGRVERQIVAVRAAAAAEARASALQRSAGPDPSDELWQTGICNIARCHGCPNSGEACLHCTRP